MKLHKVYSNIIPLSGYLAMTVFPFVFIRKESKQRFTDRVERHETTHALQQLETLWIFFFIIYGLEYIIKLFFCKFKHKRAYRSISFEQEAYGSENSLFYNEIRRHYAWRHFVFKLYKK